MHNAGISKYGRLYNCPREIVAMDFCGNSNSLERYSTEVTKDNTHSASCVVNKKDFYSK